MKALLEGGRVDIYDDTTDLEFIIEKIITGGFPGLINKSITQATDINRAYIDLLAEADMSRVSNVKRDPAKVHNLLRSLARNTATTVETVSIETDIFEKDSVTVSRPTIYDYLDALERLAYSGEYAAFEIKLGTGQIETAAANLTKFAAVIDTTKTQAPQSLNIITGTGISYTRTDGINVISLASLGV